MKTSGNLKIFKLVFLWAIIIVNVVVGGQDDDDDDVAEDEDGGKGTRNPEDFCETEAFNVTCDHDHVILMTQARYGRMRISRCVKQDYGHVGCSSDVIEMADMRCSGKQSCLVRIPDAIFTSTKPCPEDLKPYFSAAYVCVKVEHPSSVCQKPGRIPLNWRHEFSLRRKVDQNFNSGATPPAIHTSKLSPPSFHPSTSKQLPLQNSNIKTFPTKSRSRLRPIYLSNAVSHATNCGSPRSPWLAEVQRGQKIRVTLFDFGVARKKFPMRFDRLGVELDDLEGHSKGHYLDYYEGLVGDELFVKSFNKTFHNNNNNIDLFSTKLKANESKLLKKHRREHTSDLIPLAVAVDKEAGKNVTVWPDRSREVIVYTSKGHQLEIIIIITSDELSVHPLNRRFLIRLQAVGCPDFGPVQNGWTVRVDDKTSIQCNGSSSSSSSSSASQSTFILRCVDGEWQGTQPQCADIFAFQYNSGGIDVLEITQELSIMVASLTAVFIGIAILSVGLGILKHKQDNQVTRRNVECPKNQSTSTFVESNRHHHQFHQPSPRVSWTHHGISINVTKDTTASHVLYPGPPQPPVKTSTLESETVGAARNYRRGMTEGSCFNSCKKIDLLHSSSGQSQTENTMTCSSSMAQFSHFENFATADECCDGYFGCNRCNDDETQNKNIETCNYLDSCSPGDLAAGSQTTMHANRQDKKQDGGDDKQINCTPRLLFLPTPFPCADAAHPNRDNAVCCCRHAVSDSLFHISSSSSSPPAIGGHSSAFNNQEATDWSSLQSSYKISDDLISLTERKCNYALEKY